MARIMPAAWAALGVGAGFLGGRLWHGLTMDVVTALVSRVEILEQVCR